MGVSGTPDGSFDEGEAIRKGLVAFPPTFWGLTGQSEGCQKGE